MKYSLIILLLSLYIGCSKPQTSDKAETKQPSPDTAAAVALQSTEALGGVDVPSPVLPASGTQPSSFVPQGWKTLKEATGDLNGDSLDDVALILQSTEPRNISTDSTTGIELDSNPRVLAILVRDSAQTGYRLAEQNNTFIPNHDDPNMSDPFSDIQIKNGSLLISFGLWSSSGSWESSSYTYQFRYQDSQFALIGAEQSTLHRGLGEETSKSINFLTRKASITKSSPVDESVEPETRWVDFKLDKLKSLTTLTDPFDLSFVDLTIPE